MASSNKKHNISFLRQLNYVIKQYTEYFLQSNTFQAVLITNGFHSFLMYNYPHRGIQWVVPSTRYVLFASALLRIY